MPNIIEIIKKAAIEAVEASKPCSLLYGTVTSICPLKINIEQRLTLEKEHLMLTVNVRDYDVGITVDDATELASSHKHDIKGKKQITIHNGLKVGEVVVLLRIQGGQKYIVLDRVIE